MNSLEQAAKALALKVGNLLCITSHSRVVYESELETIIAKHLEAFAREQNPRNGSWTDKWLTCVCCGGEIPAGHTNNCGVYKLEQQIAQLKEQNRELLKDKEQLTRACVAAREWLGRFGEHAPIVFGGEQQLDDTLREALDKAALAKGDESEGIAEKIAAMGWELVKTANMTCDTYWAHCHGRHQTPQRATPAEVLQDVMGRKAWLAKGERGE
jgi:hypothetical protein